MSNPTDKSGAVEGVSDALATFERDVDVPLKIGAQHMDFIDALVRGAARHANECASAPIWSVPQGLQCELRPGTAD